MRKIALINAGFGNIGSVVNSISRIKLKSFTVYNGQELLNYKPSHIIMPGVGAVNQAMENLKKNNFIKPLEYFIKKKKNIILWNMCGYAIAIRNKRGIW